MIGRWLLGAVAASVVACGGVRDVPPTPTAQPTETLVVAEATPEPTPEPTPTPEPPGPVWYEYPQPFVATRYGESYNGQPMGCVGAGNYSSDAEWILAAPPDRYREWPCGTQLQVCFQDRCVDVVRVDSCPGCGRDHVDMSEAGLWYLCRDRCGVLHGVTVKLLVSAPALPGEETAKEAEDRAYTERCGDQEVVREERTCPA